MSTVESLGHLARSLLDTMFSRLYERFVADGEAHWRRSPEGIEAHRRIEQEVRLRYREKLEGAGWYKGILLQIRMRREIRAELDRAALEILWLGEESPGRR